MPAVYGGVSRSTLRNEATIQEIAYDPDRYWRGLGRIRPAIEAWNSPARSLPLDHNLASGSQAICCLFLLVWRTHVRRRLEERVGAPAQRERGAQKRRCDWHYHEGQREGWALGLWNGALPDNAVQGAVAQASRYVG